MQKYLLPCPPELLSKSEEILLNQVGTKEATGHNDGDVVKYLSAIGLGAGNAYCLAGQVYCFIEAAKELGIPAIPIPRQGLTKKLIEYAKLKGIEVTPQPKQYDLICWRYPNNIKGHVERIVKVLGPNKVQTVGFNTSNGLQGSQREGDGVFVRTRYLNKKLGEMDCVALLGWCDVD